MSYVEMADLLAANGQMAGMFGKRKKKRSQEPEQAPGQTQAKAPGGGDQSQPLPSSPQPGSPQPGSPQQASEASQVTQQASEAPWWGRGASFFFPSSPTPAAQGAPAATDMGEDEDSGSSFGGALGRVVEYIRPTARLREGSFESTAALEAGGDDMADDNDMGEDGGGEQMNMGGAQEQMLYEGLTGGETDKIASPGLSDSVDAGGQGPFVDVAVMNDGGWESDDGTGVDVLVEPGQTQAPPVGRVDRASSYRLNERSEPQAPSSEQPPVFRPGRNGTSRQGSNGAEQNGNGVHRNGNGVVPRNRITAFDSAAPLIQGTGPATAARPRGFDHVAPPNPAAFGYGLGQTPVPAPSPGVDLANKFIQAAGQVGTAAVLAKTPPQFRAGLPGMDMMPYGQQPPQQEAQSSVMPWVLGAIGAVSVVGLGYWWFTRKKEETAPVSRQIEVASPRVANPKKTKNKKSNKSKKSKGR